MAFEGARRGNNSGGNVVATYNYDVFGSIRSQTGASDNPFQFTGEQRDAESGYTYLRARYYDPTIGRFISRDPAHTPAIAPQYGNKYVYAFNNPVNLTDPTGLWPCPICDALDEIIDSVTSTGANVLNELNSAGGWALVAIIETAEVGFYGLYAASYGALDLLETLPDPIEVLFLDLEIGLTVTEAIGLGGSMLLDYLLDGDIQNVPPGNEPTSWIPDFLEELLGGDPNDANCWDPCTDLPGIPFGGDFGDVDFEFPLGG